MTKKEIIGLVGSMVEQKTDKRAYDEKTESAATSSAVWLRFAARLNAARK